MTSAPPRDPTTAAPTGPSRRGFHLALFAILAFGVVLRTVQYGAMTSMWLDELAIALNVTTRGMGELLLRPLDGFQVAPPGFLALEEAGTRLLGETEAGLRLFPWLASIGALLLFWRVADRAVGRVALLAGLLVFAASPTLVWQGATAKQYSGDVFATLLLVLLALRVDEERVGLRGATLAGALGGLAILASHPAVLVAPGLVAVLLFRRLRTRRPLAPVLALGAGWGLGAAVVTAASLLVVPAELRDSMATAWSNDFPADVIDGMATWLPLRLYGLLGYLLVYVDPVGRLENAYVALVSGLVLLGAWGLARRRPGVAVLIAIPVLVGVPAGVTQLLPLYKRISLFMAPVLLIAAMAGVDELRALLSGRLRQAATVAALALLAVPPAAVLAVGRPPYRAEEARPVLGELAARWRAGDALWVYPSAAHAMRFYGPDVEWIEGRPSGRDSRALFRQIDALRGRPRVWLFHTHGFPCEPQAVLSYLDAIGRRVDAIEDPYGLRGQREAAAYLYDLSDPARLSRTDAATHPHPTATGDRWDTHGCGYRREAGTPATPGE